MQLDCNNLSPRYNTDIQSYSHLNIYYIITYILYIIIYNALSRNIISQLNNAEVVCTILKILM